jgi:hypothetical protein
MGQRTIEPLFVLGKQRSGTTWLANQLCEHPLVAGVRHEDHRGIHASHYLSTVRYRYGDLKNKANFIEFVEVMSASSTFRFMDVNKDFLYSLWPVSYEGLFRTVMELHAQKQGARYWLEKTNEHTPLVRDIAQKYPDAKFVGVVRNVEDVVQSTLGRYSTMEWKKAGIVKNVFSWTRFNKAMLDFANASDRIHIVRYEDLKGNTQATMMAICTFLDLEFDEVMLKQAYPSNTTFHGGRERQNILSSSDKRLVKWAARVSGYLPSTVLNWRNVYTRGSQKKALPEWFFSAHPLVQTNQAKSDRNVG